MEDLHLEEQEEQEVRLEEQEEQEVHQVVLVGRKHNQVKKVV